jgi:hypothetical protein
MSDVVDDSGALRSLRRAEAAAHRAIAPDPPAAADRGHARERSTALPIWMRDGRLPNLLTAPLVYSLLVPFALLDLWTSLYQWTCFPVYGIARVRRRRYFHYDRHRLAYLNPLEKANCTFCAYAHGVVAFVREVAARTEQYWCPIRHGRPVEAPHARYRYFVDYGDAAAYKDGLMDVRRALRPPVPRGIRRGLGGRARRRRAR